MEYGLVLPRGTSTETPAWAKRAETLGYESVWQGELWGENAFVDLAVAAERTDSVRLGTAIVNVYSRSPAVIAMGAASLARVSDGRAVIGVGVSTPKAVEDLHGFRFDRPIRRTHEAVTLIKQFTAGSGRVEYDGEIFSVADFPALEVEVPVFNAALGPANRRVTGRLCDGWMPNNVPVSAMAEAFETVAEAARASGRDPAGIEVAPWIHVAVSDDPEEGMDAVRGTVAYYVGSSTGYENAVGVAYPDEAAAVATAWRAGDRAEARSRVTDEMVRDLGCAGTPEMVQEQLRELAETGVVDTVLVDIPQGLDEETISRTVEVAAPTNHSA